MNAELFKDIDSPLPPLEQARRELRAAEVDYSELTARNNPERMRELVHHPAVRRLNACEVRVRALEGEAMRRAGK